MHVGVADHLGWAVVVTASAEGQVVDRRRIDLVEPGVTAAPIHYEGKGLDEAASEHSPPPVVQRGLRRTGGAHRGSYAASVAEHAAMAHQGDR